MTKIDDKERIALAEAEEFIESLPVEVSCETQAAIEIIFVEAVNGKAEEI